MVKTVLMYFIIAHAQHLTTLLISKTIMKIVSWQDYCFVSVCLHSYELIQTQTSGIHLKEHILGSIMLCVLLT